MFTDLTSIIPVVRYLVGFKSMHRIYLQHKQLCRGRNFNIVEGVLLLRYLSKRNCEIARLLVKEVMEPRVSEYRFCILLAAALSKHDIAPAVRLHHCMILHKFP